MSADDLKFKHSFSCIMSGTSDSGKTSFCIRLPLRRGRSCLKKFHILRGRTGEFWWGGGGSDESTLVILDDLLNEVYRSKCVTCLREAAITEI